MQAGANVRSESFMPAAAHYVFDSAIALATLVVLSPVLLIVAVLIKLDSPGPVIFRQTRVGKDRKEFTFLKFRSMYADADQQVHVESFDRYANGIAAEVNGDTVSFKPSSDARVTRVGRILRSTSLDEIPQLLNVLTGKMRLVGPRPAIPYELAYYEDWYFQRFDVTPGVTGVWQVYGRSNVTFQTMIKMDVEYVRTRSFRLDLKLLFLTAYVVFLRKGAY